MLENPLPASSPGSSGLSFDHLRELTRSETVTQPHQGLTAALARFADCFASSPMPPAAASGLAGAPLTPLRKEVTDVRPIAVGETLRRLTGKLLKNRAREKAGTLLAPRQLGVSVSGGAEALIHSLHRLHTEFGKQSEVAILQVDFANAFNLISRRAMFCAVRTHFPELLQYVETCYGDNTDPVLWCQDLQLYSRTGCQQGDPLGPLLFSITLHDFLSHAPKEVRANEAGGADISRIPMWYLDDGYIFGRHESLQQYTSFLDSPLARRYGLYLKLIKCKIWWPTAPDDSVRAAYPSTLPQLYTPGTWVMKTPIGSFDFLRRGMLFKVKEILKLFPLLHGLNNAHTAFYLLRSCLSSCRLIHLLRVIPPAASRDGAALFDQEIQEFMRSMVGGVLPAATAREIRLPVRSTKPTFGMGLTSAVTIAPSAYIASSLLVHSLLPGLLPKPSQLAQFDYPPLLAARDEWHQSVDFMDRLSLEEIDQRQLSGRYAASPSPSERARSPRSKTLAELPSAARAWRPHQSL